MYNLSGSRYITWLLKMVAIWSIFLLEIKIPQRPKFKTAATNSFSHTRPLILISVIVVKWSPQQYSSQPHGPYCVLWIIKDSNYLIYLISITIIKLELYQFRSLLIVSSNSVKKTGSTDRVSESDCFEGLFTHQYRWDVQHVLPYLFTGITSII